MSPNDRHVISKSWLLEILLGTCIYSILFSNVVKKSFMGQDTIQLLLWMLRVLWRNEGTDFRLHVYWKSWGVGMKRRIPFFSSHLASFDNWNDGEPTEQMGVPGKGPNSKTKMSSPSKFFCLRNGSFEEKNVLERMKIEGFSGVRHTDHYGLLFQHQRLFYKPLNEHAQKTLSGQLQQNEDAHLDASQILEQSILLSAFAFFRQKLG